MRRFMFAGAAALALAFVAAVPAPSQASWLSQFLHSRFDPDYYAAPAYPYGDYYYAPPAGDYYYAPPTVYYTEPYVVTGPTYYGWSGPRYYGHYHGYRGEWHGHEGHGHEGHGHHHR